MPRITKTFVDTVAPPPLKNGQKTQAFYRDSALPGFGLRVTSAGAKAFIVEIRIANQVKRTTLGKYGLLTVEQARKMAQQFLGKVAGGGDPIAEEREHDLAATTLRQIFDDYLSTRKDLKATTIHDYTRQIEGAFGDWQNKRLTTITKDMVELRHRELGQRSPARANGAMRVLRALFNHAMHKLEDRDGEMLLRANPVDRLRQNRAWYTVERRQTIIKPHQLAAWYAATLQLNHQVTGDYFHFLLFTGLRRSEGARLLWSDVDFADRTMRFPDTKNRSTHTLPLSDFLFELLQRRKLEQKGPWVFPSPLHDGHLKEPREAVSRVSAVSGVTFTLHDLRRTFITIAESLDIPAYALKRLLNHKDPNDVTAGYIINDVERLRAPMQKIADFIYSKLIEETGTDA